MYYRCLIAHLIQILFYLLIQGSQASEHQPFYFFLSCPLGLYLGLLLISLGFIKRPPLNHIWDFLLKQSDQSQRETKSNPCSVHIIIVQLRWSSQKDPKCSGFIIKTISTIKLNAFDFLRLILLNNHFSWGELPLFWFCIH
jgi:hypothetical protein